MRSSVARWMRSAAALAGPALLGVAVLALAGPSAQAQAVPTPSSRVALVVGEGAYRAGPRPAAPADAGLVAQLLAGAGFDVTGARDLDGDGLRRTFRDFLDRAGAAGPDGIAVVYIAGRAIQSDGDDFVVPVDARLARPSDVPIEALRLADFTHALAALPIQARVVIIDGAYGAAAGAGPAPGAPGLALMEAEQGELLAFNAAPGTVAPPSSGPYGAYAQALTAVLKQGGVPIGEVFGRVRLAVNQATQGAVVPWSSDKLTRSFTMFDRAPGAPAVSIAQVPFAALEKRPLRDFPPAEAYDVALARDTLAAYSEFLADFPGDALARRVRPILAVRREALFWRAAVQGNAPGAFWTYLVRYPKGPHAADARRRLTRLAAAAAPPPRFVPLGFDVPPPGPGERVDDRVTVFDAPGLPPPPPPPMFLLPPPVDVVLQRPLPPFGPGFLPLPPPVAIPHVRPPVDPGTIAPPRGVAGNYPHPRPYARGPNGEGLVVQGAPPAPEGRPRPGAPSDAQPNPVPAGAPVPRSPAVPQPVPPQGPSAAPPVPPAPAGPRPPIVAQPRPVPEPGQPGGPVSPMPPVAPVPPTSRPAPVPPAATGSPLLPPGQRPQEPHHQTLPGDRPAPGGAATRPPSTPPSAPPTPANPAAVEPPGEAPRHQATPVPPVPKPEQSRPPGAPVPKRLAPSQPPVPPAAGPGPAAAGRLPPSTIPSAPHPAAPERPPAAPPALRPAPPGHPAPVPPAADHPGAGAGHPPVARRPACGRPGEAPCRP